MSGGATSIDVLHLQRKPGPGSFSVERLFEDVRAETPSDISIRLRINEFMSQGVVGRVRDAIAAWRNRSQVNHVLGDVHYLAWFLPRHSTVLTVLDCVTLERLTGWRRRLFWFLWYWWPLKRCEHVTVISTFSGESLRKWVSVDPKRIHMIPPPLSHEFAPAPRSHDGPRSRLLQIGTSPNKNLPRVIEAIADLPVTLAIIGEPDGESRRMLNELEIEHEIHTGLSRAELVDQYRQADVVVFASTYEGFGMPIVEANAVGRPVVAGNVCSMPEAAGDAAWMVDPFDVSDIRRGIESLLEDSEQVDALVERGFENAKRYSPKRIAEEYAQVYRLVAAPTRNA